MNYIDIILCIPLIWGFYRGFKRGFIIEVASLFAFWIGIYAGVKFSNFLTAHLKTLFGWTSPYLPLVSFAFLFLGVLIIVYLLAKLIEGFANAIALGIINKLLGAVAGVLKFALIMSILLFLLDSVERRIQFVPIKTKKESLLYQPVAKVAPFVLPRLRGNIEIENWKTGI